MEAVDLDPVSRLSRDIAAASTTLSADEARFLVDAYYTMQEDRIRASNQIRALSESGEPHRVLQWLFDQTETLEKQIKRSLGKYSESDPLGRWALSICGIGPVIAAGLLAHIDIEKAETAGAIYRFAGLDPTQTWEKGQKRPWNGQLKTLQWKIGQSFMKVQGRDNDVYGRLYKERKEYELARNEAGELKPQADAKLEKYRIGKTTDAYAWYSAGKLPPAHIDARARRWVVKLFLSHYHEVAYFVRYNRLPPNPYPIVHLGHAHRIEVPNKDMVPGLAEARREA